MQKQWVEKNVDLALLSRYVEDFFKVRGFKTKRDELAGEHKILVIPERGQDLRENVNLRILGNPNDFMIELIAGEQARSAIWLGYTTTMIGGGSLLLRGLKSRETLEKLEKEFWAYSEDAVVRLVNSAGALNPK
jgi:hypothetical protein